MANWAKNQTLALQLFSICYANLLPMNLWDKKRPLGKWITGSTVLWSKNIKLTTVEDMKYLCYYVHYLYWQSSNMGFHWHSMKWWTIQCSFYRISYSLLNDSKLSKISCATVYKSTEEDLSILSHIIKKREWK